MKKKVLIAIITFCLTFLILDRLLHQNPQKPCSVYQPDPYFQQTLIQGKSCREKTTEFDVQYHINEHGLRDNPFDMAKAKNTFRILMLGDSFTFGVGVDIQDTIAKQLEKGLISKFPIQKFQVINGGISAYAPISELVYLKKRGINFNPDLVILNLSMTDFLEEIAYTGGIQIDQNGETVFFQNKKPSLIEEYLKNNSFTYNVFLANKGKLWKLKGRFVDFIQKKGPPDYVYSGLDSRPGDPKHDLFAITRPINDEVFEKLFSPAMARVLEMKKYLDEKKIPMVLIVIPHGHQVAQNQWVLGRKLYKLNDESYPDKIFERLAKYAVDNEILFVNPVFKMRDYLTKNPNDKLFFDLDGHFTPLGPRIVSETIYEYLTGQNSDCKHKLRCLDTNFFDKVAKKYHQLGS